MSFRPASAAGSHVYEKISTELAYGNNDNHSNIDWFNRFSYKNNTKGPTKDTWYTNTGRTKDCIALNYWGEYINGIIDANDKGGYYTRKGNLYTIDPYNDLYQVSNDAQYVLAPRPWGIAYQKQEYGSAFKEWWDRWIYKAYRRLTNTIIYVKEDEPIYQQGRRRTTYIWDAFHCYFAPGNQEDPTINRDNQLTYLSSKWNDWMDVPWAEAYIWRLWKAGNGDQLRSNANDWTDHSKYFPNFGRYWNHVQQTWNPDYGGMHSRTTQHGRVVRSRKHWASVDVDLDIRDFKWKPRTINNNSLDWNVHTNLNWQHDYEKINKYISDHTKHNLWGPDGWTEDSKTGSTNGIMKLMPVSFMDGTTAIQNVPKTQDIPAYLDFWWFYDMFDDTLKKELVIGLVHLLIGIVMLVKNWTS